MISVMDHGAKGDGVADDRAAFEAAGAAAGNRTPFARGAYFFAVANSAGRGERLEIRIDGVVRAPPMELAAAAAAIPRCRGAAAWRAASELRRCRAIVISGRGTIEGQGHVVGAEEGTTRVRAPALLVIRESHDCAVRYPSLVESPFYHVVVLTRNASRWTYCVLRRRPGASIRTASTCWPLRRRY